METESIGIAGIRAAVKFETVTARPPQRAARLLVRDSDVFHVVKVRDVEWIDACGNYVKIHAGGKTLIQRATLNGIAGRLPANKFARIHRSLIVNTRKVRELRRISGGRSFLVMASGEKLSANRTVHEIQGALMRA
jgi:two-component system LytT family response regulator